MSFSIPYQLISDHIMFQQNGRNKLEITTYYELNMVGVTTQNFQNMKCQNVCQRHVGYVSLQMGPQGLDYPGTFELVQVQCFPRMFPLAGCDTNVVRKESRALRWWGSACCMKVKIELKHPLFTGCSEIGEHWIHCKASLNLLFRLLSGRTAFHWANYDKLGVEPWWFGHGRKNVVHPVFGLTINDHESSLAHVPWLWKSEPFFFVLLVVLLGSFSTFGTRGGTWPSWTSPSGATWQTMGAGCGLQVWHGLTSYMACKLDEVTVGYKSITFAGPWFELPPREG